MAEKKYYHAEICLAEMLRKERQAPPDVKPRDAWLIAETWRLRGRCLAKLKRYPEAEQMLLSSYSVIRPRFGDAHPRVRETRQWLYELNVAWGRPDKARQYAGRP